MDQPTPEQLTFLRVPRYVSETLPLSELPDDRHLTGDPSKALIESIRDFGVAHPIIVRDTGHARYEIVDGRRRVKALRALGRETVEAHIIDPGDVDPLLLAASLHATRSENVATLVNTLRDLLLKYPDPREMALLTGYPLATIKKYLPLTDLSRSMHNAMCDGKVSASTLLQVMKLPTEGRAEANLLLEEQGTLTMAQVKELKTASRQQAYTTLAMDDLLAQVPTLSRAAQLKSELEHWSQDELAELAQYLSERGYA